MMKKAVTIFIVLSAIVGTATTVRAEGDKGLIGITTSMYTNMLHVTSYWQIIVKGLLILFAVYLDTLRSSKRLKIKRKG